MPIQDKQVRESTLLVDGRTVGASFRVSLTLKPKTYQLRFVP